MLTEEQQAEVDNLIKKFERHNILTQRVGVAPKLSTTTSVYFDNPSNEEFVKIVHGLPPTKQLMPINENPMWYVAIIKNPATPDPVINPFKLKLEWASDVGDVIVTFSNIERFDAWVKQSRREIASFEDCYFQGESQNWIRNRRIECYIFRSPNFVQYQGGQCTLLDEAIVNEIMVMLLN